jgi:transcriptional regulator with XRE-family HTH domain
MSRGAGLARYLRAHRTTLAAFADKIGMTAASVSRLARGRQRPNWRTMMAIRIATDGAVMPNDFFEP